MTTDGIEEQFTITTMTISTALLNHEIAMRIEEIGLYREAHPLKKESNLSIFVDDKVVAYLRSVTNTDPQIHSGIAVLTIIIYILLGFSIGLANLFDTLSPILSRHHHTHQEQD